MLQRGCVPAIAGIIHLQERQISTPTNILVSHCRRLKQVSAWQQPLVSPKCGMPEAVSSAAFHIDTTVNSNKRQQLLSSYTSYVPSSCTDLLHVLRHLMVPCLHLGHARPALSHRPVQVLPRASDLLAIGIGSPGFWLRAQGFRPRVLVGDKRPLLSTRPARYKCMFRPCSQQDKG